MNKKLSEMSAQEFLEHVAGKALEQATEKIIDRKSNEIADKILQTLDDRINVHASKAEQKIKDTLIEKMPI